MGDIGDNEATRAEINVYRVSEPTVPGPGGTAASAASERIVLRYADGPHDAEALLVDARNGDLVIITKVAAGRATVTEPRAHARAPTGHV